MTLVSQTLSRLAVGAPERHRNLTIIPLLDGRDGASPYLTLHDALEAGILEITEVSEAGSVPTLQARNKGDRGVLILDGEELVGAKQNRIVNVTILVAAHATVAIPVSCVEQGRWAWRSRHFGESKQTMHAAGRRRNIREVSESLKQSRSYRGDQMEVWDEVAAKARRMNVESSTGALGDVYNEHDESLDDYGRGFQPSRGQVGAVFAVNGRVRGLELFEDSSVYRTVVGKLVRSYALDALERLNEQEKDAAPDSATVDAFLEEVGAATESRFPGVGLGETIRLESSAVVGSGLALGDQLLHLAAFATRDG
jgi:hypothetical protein